MRTGRGIAIALGVLSALPAFAQQAADSSCGSTTLKQAVACLGGAMSASNRETVLSKGFWDLIQYHHGWGTSIRNTWGFWSGSPPIRRYFNAHGVTHPDEMSMRLIESLWLDGHACALEIDSGGGMKPWWMIAPTYDAADRSAKTDAVFEQLGCKFGKPAQ